MKSDLTKAMEQLQEGQYTCVLCRGDIMYTSRERGVRPLLDWLDGDADIRGFSAADKVVGKAAAFLYVLLGVKEIYAHVVSRAAMGVFKENHISFSYDISTDYIINRQGTGSCPMEEAVSGISRPEDAPEAIRRRLEELKRRSL